MGLLSFAFYGILFSVASLVVYYLWVLQKRAAYFKKYGVPYLGAGLARTFRTFTGATHLFQLEEEYYAEAKKTKAPLVAISDLTGQVSLMATDPDLIKRIMVKDFDHFVNIRPFDTANTSKYLNKMLFVMKDEQWKAMRAKMTPAFTTGKIKRMHQIFASSAQRMDTYLKWEIGHPQKQSVDVDFFKLLFKYSMDVIASCAFGVDSKSWETRNVNEFTTFEQFGKKMEFQFDFKSILKLALLSMSPKIADLLELDFLNSEAQVYFANIVKDVVKHRRQTGERREDFLQLMMDIQTGLLKADEGDIESKSAYAGSADKLVFDDDYLISNALMFFLGGFDTTNTVMVFCVYSAALEQNAQQKLYEDIQAAMNKHGGKLTYEALFDMPYLDMFINEVMRMYPAASRVERACTSNYIVEETGFKIEKGNIVVIPVHGIHNDAKYYDNPEKFIPERFSPEEKANRHQYTYLPFGHGPRSCPGLRFALLKVKAVIAQLISSYKVAPCSKTSIPMKFGSGASAKPLDGMWLNVTVRE